MKESNITVSKTAKYYTLGELSEQTKQIWFVCHGYGQLARFFLRKFEVLDDGHNFIVAPEGLHRFYLSGTSGRVGASWMTKEAREDDIKDYINYLDALYIEVLSKTTQKVTINVLGFSQGAATVSRWIGNGKTSIDNLILWSGIFPPDMNFEVNRGALEDLNIHLVIGNQDEYIEQVDIEEQQKALHEKKIPFKLLSFDGNHDIDTDTLVKLSQTL